MQNLFWVLRPKENQFGVSLLAWLTCRIFLGFSPGITFPSELRFGCSWTLWKVHGVHNLAISHSVEIGAHICAGKLSNCYQYGCLKNIGL